MKGICRICGRETEGEDFVSWVRDTFTNYDQLQPGSILCRGCAFWFDQRSTALQELMGKDKPQKMQNYSHFILRGDWIPVSKGDKRKMADILLSGEFPEMAAIAESGQKHIAFRARRNPPGASAGWVQFEEQSLWIDQAHLREVLGWIEDLYYEFSKGEIESGKYHPRRILNFGVERWRMLEDQIKPIRQTGLFQLALFLAQRSDDDDDGQSNGSNAAQDHLERNSKRLQEPLSDDNLGAIRERDPQRGIHRESGEVHQLDLFTFTGRYRENGS